MNIVNVIQTVAGESIKVVDSREGVVTQALKVWNLNNNSGASQGIPTREGDISLLENLPLLFVSGFSDKKDEKEYHQICNKFGLKYCNEL